MKLHPTPRDKHGAGHWHRATTRYIPVTGGSRSRLPLTDDHDIPRYHGFVGIDERLTENISTIATLYEHIGGAPRIPDGRSGDLARAIQKVTEEQLAAAAEEAAEREKEAQRQSLMRSSE